MFTAAHISTAIDDAACVDFRESPADAYERLSPWRFDQAPVLDHRHVVGWVRTANLCSAPNMKHALKPLAECAIVAEDATIADVLQLLASAGFVFTVDERGIHGFVTPSDLERHAARSHFYLLIAGIEMQLARIVRSEIDDAEILARLTDELRQRWDEDSATSDETSPAEYLYLQELAELFLELPEATPEHGWHKSHTNDLTRICKFRPSVMHPSRSLIKGQAPADLASIARAAEEVTVLLAAIGTG